MRLLDVNAADLGIDLAQDWGLYKWLLASFLMGKRIRATVAVEAYRALVDEHGLDTPGKLARCSHHDLVRLLGQAGYARYDESTARRLRPLGQRLEAELPDQLARLHSGAHPLALFERWLLSFEGIGPKTVEIFMRDAGPTLE